jgi:hypothetical protein
MEYLKEKFNAVADRDTRKCILLALASSRTESAIEFLLELIRQGSDLAVSAMSIHAGDARLQEAVEQAKAGRDRPASS